MKLVKESWLWFLRDWRAGELTLLLMALILAVAATSSLRFFSSGVELRMQQESSKLMAADRIVRSSRDIPPVFKEAAEQHKLDTAQLLEFSSVIQHNDDFHLSAIRAASEGHPLRGEIRLLDKASGEEKTVFHIPEPGEAWLDERLTTLLNVKTGDTIILGELPLKVSAILAHEPGQGMGSSLFAPRTLINLADVAATGIVQPGSRLRHQLLLRGDDDNLLAWEKAVTPHLSAGIQLLGINNSNPEIARSLNRSQSYFSLASMAAVLLAGLAIVASMRRFAERHYDTLALMRCLGASRRQSMLMLLGEIVWSGLIALIIGALIGAFTAATMAYVLRDMLPVEISMSAIGRPLLTGALTAFLTLIGFALPTLLALGRVSPLRVLRRDLLPADWSLWLISLLALSALTLLLVLETGQVSLTLWVVGGGTVLVFVLRALFMAVMRFLRPRLKHPAFNHLLRNPPQSSTQILGLALGISALLLVAGTRDELMGAWQASMPADAPNHFAINIASDEKAGFEQFLQSQSISSSDFFPIVRGRLVAINDKPLVNPAKDKGTEAERDESLNRELNLTWRNTLHKGTELLEGQWWPENEPCQCVSMESKLAERLGIKLGDKLTFNMAEGALSTTVTSLRKVDWNSFQPNFYFIFPESELQSFPQNYMTGFRFTGDRKQLAALVKTFPTITLIDVSSLMQEVSLLLDQMSRALQAVFIFVLAGGLLVIAAQTASSLEQRQQEAALLRVTGISRRELQKRLFSEYCALGAAAGLLAALVNEILLALVYQKILETSPVLHPNLWWQAVLAGAVLVLAAGFMSARKTWAVSPLILLKHS